MLRWSIMMGLPSMVTASAVSLDLQGGQQVSLAVYGSGLAVLVALIWALCERAERRTVLRQNEKLLSASRKLLEEHYRERVQAEERHLLAHDSTVRNILEHLERTVLGRPNG